MQYLQYKGDKKSTQPTNHRWQNIRPKRSTTNTTMAAKHPPELNDGKVSASKEKGGKASAKDDQRNLDDADETGGRQVQKWELSKESIDHHR
jgi:hypothetical protein